MSSPPPPFQRFLDTHRDAVWRFLVCSVGPVEAEDCFQETFIAALRAYARLREGSNLRAWVLTIAHRKALDAHRSRGRRPIPLEDADTGGAGRQDAARVHVDAPPMPDETLWDAVRRLPPRQRSAVVLRYVGDLAHADIAAAIGCSEAAARRSLHEGLSKLREVVVPV